MTTSPDRSDPITEALTDQQRRGADQVAALERALASMIAASESSNADDEHDPEGATIAFERAQLAAALAHARAGMGAAQDALVRREQGTYGVCSGCGGAIASSRLAALPAAATCITCASRPR